ncbi:hypothetical protein LINPERHAP2_LOCUS12004 [Linum perenne]
MGFGSAASRNPLSFISTS